MLALVILVVLVHILHGEYLGYVDLSGDRAFLVWSYVAKWLILAIGLLVYLLYAVSTSKAPSRPEIRPGVDKRPLDTLPPVADDGFDFLRKRVQLQGRAEKLLSRKPLEK
ncbi:MAG: hypothetical protein R3E50_00560 [Halioglobus sp.]